MTILFVARAKSPEGMWMAVGRTNAVRIGGDAW